MEIIGLYIASLASTFTIESALVTRMLYDIANQGYKINKGSNDSFEFSNSEKNIKFLYLIPIVNIGYALNSIIQYTLNKESFLMSLSITDMIKKMSNSEIKSFEENKTIKNVLKINFLDDDIIEKTRFVQEDYDDRNIQDQLHYLREYRKELEQKKLNDESRVQSKIKNDVINNNIDNVKIKVKKLDKNKKQDS